MSGEAIAQPESGPQQQAEAWTAAMLNAFEVAYPAQDGNFFSRALADRFFFNRIGGDRSLQVKFLNPDGSHNFELNYQLVTNTESSIETPSFSKMVGVSELAEVARDDLPEIEKAKNELAGLLAAELPQHD